MEQNKTKQKPTDLKLLLVFPCFDTDLVLVQIYDINLTLSHAGVELCIPTIDSSSAARLISRNL